MKYLDIVKYVIYALFVVSLVLIFTTMDMKGITHNKDPDETVKQDDYDAQGNIKNIPNDLKYLMKESDYISTNITRDFKMRFADKMESLQHSNQGHQGPLDIDPMKAPTKYESTKIVAPVLESFHDYMPLGIDLVKFFSKESHLNAQPINKVVAPLADYNKVASVMKTVWDNKSPDTALETFYKHRMDQLNKSIVPNPDDWKPI